MFFIPTAADCFRKRPELSSSDVPQRSLDGHYQDIYKGYSIDLKSADGAKSNASPSVNENINTASAKGELNKQYLSLDRRRWELQEM